MIKFKHEINKNPVIKLFLTIWLYFSSFLLKMNNFLNKKPLQLTVNK